MLRYALLGLLAEQPRHGYDLKKAFEGMLGGTWPVNIGQIYSTLARLERDGLVVSQSVPQELLPDRKVYSLTDRGREALAQWLETPLFPPARLKVDFFLKLLLARRSGMVDVCALIWKQRQAFLQAMAELTSLLSRSEDVELRLLAEGLLYHLEADLKWLDRCEETFCTEGEPPAGDGRVPPAGR